MSETSKYFQNVQGNNLSETQKAGLLIGLILSEQHHFAKDCLETGWSEKKAAAFLEEVYLSKKKTTAYGLLNFIRDEGERTVYNIILPHLLSTNDREKRKTLLRENYMSIDLFLKYCDNFSDCELLLNEENLLTIDEKDLKKGILAWDMAKLVSIARLSFDAKLISEKDAWAYIENGCIQCREMFSNWEEVAKSFVIGAAIEKGLNETFTITLNYIADALKGKESLWKQIALKPR